MHAVTQIDLLSVCVYIYHWYANEGRSSVSQVEMLVAQYIYNLMFASTCHCCVDYASTLQEIGYTCKILATDEIQVTNILVKGWQWLQCSNYRQGYFCNQSSLISHTRNVGKVHCYPQKTENGHNSILKSLFIKMLKDVELADGIAKKWSAVFMQGRSHVTQHPYISGYCCMQQFLFCLHTALLYLIF